MSLLNPIPNTNMLITIKKNCDNSHKHCQDIYKEWKKYPNAITQTYLNDFFQIIKLNNYNSCLSHSNNFHKELKSMFNSVSAFLEIPSWGALLLYCSDEELNTMIKNQIKYLTPSIFIDSILKTELILNHGPKMNFLNILLSHHPMKLKSFESIIMNMEIIQFSKYLKIMTKNHNNQVDQIIIKFINANKTKLKLPINKEIGLKIIDYFINKSQIIKLVYECIQMNITNTEKKDIFNKTIGLRDDKLTFMILESNDIIPDIDSINKLIGDNISGYAFNYYTKNIADFIDLLCEYGLIITKDIVINLVDKGYYINNIEKYNIEIDSDILVKCSNHSFYPYKFDIKPSSYILIKECSKPDNLNTIKKLKEYGGVYNSECLEEACGIPRNTKVIKFLICDCGVKVTEKCLEKFQNAYKIDVLELIMTRYKKSNPDIKIEQPISRNCNLDPESVMVITPKNNIKIDINDNNIDYTIKKKIKKFFDIKKSIIKYIDLYQIVLKYLINNKLVIGNYFIINQKLSNLLKINCSTIIHIDQLHSIITYFIDNTNILPTIPLTPPIPSTPILPTDKINV